MKMREKLHRLFAGLLAVVILTTSISLDSFAQNGEELPNGNGEIVTEVLTQEMTEDDGTELTVIPEDTEDAKEPEEGETPEVSEDTEEPEEAGTPEVSENTGEPEETEDTKNPEDAEEPEKTEDTKNSEDAEEPEETEDIKNPEDAEEPEETENPEDAENPEETEETEKTELYQLTGRVFVDFDEDGEQAEDEEGIVGVTVRVYDAENEEPLDVTETDENGDYLLEGLKEGAYTIEFDVDDEEASVFDFVGSAANISEDTELPGADEQWELRCVNVEVSEDRKLDLGFMVSMDILSDIFDVDMMAAEPVAAYGSTVNVTATQMTLDGRKVYWKNYDVTGKKIDSSIYPYNQRCATEYPNVWLFCLDRSADAAGKHTKYSDIPDSVKKDADVKKYCKRVAYFAENWPGRGSLTANQKKKYHLAAQMLIWDRLHKETHRVFLANAKNTKIEKEVDLTAEKNDIKARVTSCDTAKGKPSFNGQTLTAIRDNVGNADHVYTYTDTNGVLSEYEVVKDELGDGIKNVDIKGNQLIVTMEGGTQYNNKPHQIKLKRVNTGIANACYVSNDSQIQPLLMWGSIGVYATVNINYVAQSTITISKTDDSGVPVENVTFRWGYDEKNLTNVTSPTNPSGQVTITAQCPGTVYIKEETVPLGLEKSAEIKPVHLNAGQSFSVSFVNKRMRPVTLKKVDSETGAAIPNATFEYYVEGKSTKYTGRTGSDGTFTSPAIFFAGETIIMTETSSGVDYLKPASAAATQRLTLSTDNTKNVFTFKNTPYKVRLKITKYNSRTNEPVEGMVFRIGTDPTLTDSTKYKDYTTDKNGEIISDWIRRDSFLTFIYYQEVGGPGNIKIDSRIRNYAFTKGTDFEKNLTVEIPVYNEEEPVQIRVKKTGSDGKPLDGVSFNVQRYSSGSWISVETIRTANGGYALTKTTFDRDDIAKGYIRLVETSLGTNKGYEMLREPVIVPASLADVEDTVIEVSAENPKIPTELTIYKYDKDSKKPLANAYFQITDANGNWVQTLRTGTDGKASTTELYADTVYYIEETVVPKGYEKYGVLKGKVWFKLTKDGKVVTADGTTETIDGKPYSYYFNWPNDPVYGYIEIYKTDTEGRPLEGIEFTIYKNGVPVAPTLITDKNGYAKSGKLLADAGYRIEETYCPPQYSSIVRYPPSNIDFLNSPYDGTSGDWRWSFDNSTLTMTFNIINHEKFGTVSIRKIDSETGEPVKGATIRLVNRYTGASLGSNTTNANGWAYFYNVPLVNPMISSTQGYYYVEETTPGENHILPENTKQYFSLTVDEPNLTKEITFANPPVRGTVEIKKVDKDDPSQVLQDAEFAVYEAEAYEAAVAANQTPKAIDTQATGSDGVAAFNLRYGDYIIKETKASKYHFNDLENGGLLGTPEGVTYDKTVQGYRVTISEHGKTIPFTVANPKLKIQVEVTKYGYNKKLLSNVKFNICKADGTVVEQIQTGNNGKATSGEYYAEYLGEGAYVIEAEKYPNYELNTTKYPISVTSEKNIEVELKPIEVTNTREVPNLKLLKVNEEGEKVTASFHILAYSTFSVSGEIRFIDESFTTSDDSNPMLLSSIFEKIDKEYESSNLAPGYIPVIIEISENETEAPYLKITGDVLKLKYSPWIEETESRLEVISAYGGVGYDANTLTYTVVNEPIPITLNLIKIDSTYQYLSGAEFSIQPNGIDAEPILVTSNGTSAGISVELPYAESYTVTELKAPEGYLNSYGSHTIYLTDFTQTKDSSNNITAYKRDLYVTNLKRNMRIRKLGSDGEPLDATFTVTSSDGTKSTVVTTKKEDDGYGWVNLADVLNVNEDGYVWGGSISIEETDVDSNYILEEIKLDVDVYANEGGTLLATCTFTPSNVEITQTGGTADNKIDITVTDTRKSTTFNLKKKGLGSDYVEAELRLQAYQGSSHLLTKAVNINSKYSVSTDFFDSLISADGYDVYISEYSTTTGYNRLSIKAFTYYPDKEGAEKFQDVDEHISIVSDIGTDSNTFTITLTNEPGTAELRIKKIDDETGLPLKGAEITVATSNGVTKTVTTTGAAEGDLLELPYAASYTITEVKAPDGYEALTESKTMSISEFTWENKNGKYYYKGEVTLENTRKFEFYINKTDEFGNPAEATFQIRMYGSGMSSFTETVETKNGKADLTPVLEKAKTKGTPSSGYWYFYIYETGTEEGLQRYTDRIAYCRFYPGNIGAGSKNFVTLVSSSYVSKIDYGDISYASASVTLANKNIPINLTVIKKETGSSPVKYLEGAVFEILPEGKNAIEVTTNATAAGVTVQLPYAKSYIVTEKSAPDGYIKDSTVYTYSIDDFTKTGSGTNITAYNKSVTYTNDPIKGYIKISKYDEAEPYNQDKMALMAGAEFEIYEGTVPATGTEEEKYNAVSKTNGYTLVDTVTIGTDGTGTSKLLPYGDYVIKETKAPADYDLSYELQEKSIRKDKETVQVVYTDQRKEGSLTIYKWEKDTKKPLANAKFQVYDAETNEPVGTELYTGVDGKIGPISLPYGSYYIKEIDAPPGYITISGDWEQPFDINDQSQEVIQNVDNEKPSYALKLLKQNEEGNYLAGAVFGVFADGEEPDSRPEPENAIVVFTTGSTGIAIQPLEDAGDYDIYELKAPDGYELITEKVADIHVDKDSPTAEVKAENHHQMISLTILKVDEEDQTPLAGAVFEIRNQTTGVLVATTEPTDENGEVIVEVPAGNITYTVTEITAPGAAGEYVLDTEPKEITVTGKEDAEGNVTFEAKPLTVTNKKAVKGTIKLIKTEEGKPDIPVEGAVYGVYDSSNHKVAELKTKSNGEAQVSELEFGTYTVREIELPYGYGSGTITPDEVTLSEETQVMEIHAEDPPLLNGFKVKKVDVSDNTKTLSGAEFKVFASWDEAYDYDLNQPDDSVVVAAAESGENGIAVFENLRYGTYYVRETSAPEGYAVSLEIVEVTVNADSMKDAAVITYEDYPATGTFRVKKTDKDTGAALAGAVFTVEEVSDAPDKYSEEYITGADGTFETEVLDFGTYRVTETSAPEGYRLSDPVTQTVVLDQDSWNTGVTVTFANERIQIPITIHKTDDADKPLAGAGFAIYAVDEEGNRGEEPIERLVTGPDGSATSTMLPIGSYVLVEEYAPDGYEIAELEDSDYFDIVIDENTQASIEKTVANTPVTGKLRIEKKNADTKQGMNGVEFPVYRLDGSLYDTAITETVNGVDGVAILEDVPYGIYYVKETVPKGYEDQEINEVFRIGSEPEEREALLEVENIPIKGSFALVKVDAENPNTTVAGAVYGIYTELNEDGTVKENSYLGEDYNLVTQPDIQVEGSDDTVHQWAESKELAYGTYYVKELASPDDYKLNDEIYTVEIKEHQTYVEVVAEDTKYTGSVTVHKVDQHKNPVEGAVFAVYTKEDYERLDTDINVPAQYITTDETGTAALDGLLLHQTYVMIEDMAPAGYEKDADFYEEFTPEKNQLTFEFTCTNTKLDEIVVRKVDDRGNPLVLAIFGLYSSGADQIPQTGDDIFIDSFGNANSLAGYARYNISDFAEGSYYVTELQKPGGQYVLSDEIIEFTITEERRSFEFNFVNEPYEARLKLQKLDENNQPLTGAVFALYELDYAWNEEILDYEASETLIQTISMEDSSEALIKGLRADTTYLLRETSAPDGYARVGDKEIKFIEDGKLTKDKQGDTYFYCAVDIVNEPAKGKIQIQKAVENTTGIEAEYSLEGAEFEITNSSNQKVGKTLVTAADGIAVSEELPYGVYRITEIKAPDGTIRNTEIGTVNIDGTQADGIYEYTHTNPIPTGKLQILKKDENGDSLDGAVFEVLRYGTVVDELTTVNGMAESKELPYGTYIIRETKAPTGHKFGEVTEWTREINASLSTVVIEVTNPSSEGQGIHVVKYDKDDPTIYLEGAVFDLYTEENWNDVSENRQPFKSGLATDENGYLDVTDLEEGSYVLVETAAPEPYVVDDTPHPFTLGEDEYISLNIPNEKPKGRILFTKAGDLLTGIEEDTSYQNLKKLIWSEGSVEDAEIGIYTTEEVSWNGRTYEAGALICTLKSGETSDYLPVGVYEYQEMSAPSAYIPDTGRYEITVTAETVAAPEPTEAKLINRHAEAEIELYKGFSNAESLTAEQLKENYAKVKFGVYTSEEIKGKDVSIPINTLVAVFGVDETGKSNFVSRKLPEGAYYVRELETAEGYLTDMEEYSFTLMYNHENAKVQISAKEEPIINEPIYGIIQVVKIGPAFTALQAVPGPENKWTVNLPVYTEEEISGGTFEIRTKNAVVIDGESYEANAVVDTIGGGESSRDLPLGIYTVTEVSAPEGYLESDEIYEVELSEDENSQEAVVEEVRIRNEKAAVQLPVYKSFFGLTDEEAAELYPEVYFGVYAAEEIRGYADTAVLSKDMLVNLIQIGKDGVGTLDDYLPAGNYYVKELATAEGYELSEEKYYFTVEADSQGIIEIEGISEDNEIINYPEGGVEFTFRKIDERSKPLAGATFKLYWCKNEEEGHVHSELAGTDGCWVEIGEGLSRTSGENGIVDFGNLPNGDYQLKETQAPDGYELPEGQWRIYVDSEAANQIRIEACGENTPPAFQRAEDTAQYQYQLPNYKRRELPMSGGLGLFPYMGGGSALLSAAALLLKKRRKEESEEE